MRTFFRSIYELKSRLYPGLFVENFFRSMYDLMGRFTQPPVNAEEIKQHVETVYERLDPKKTGNISLREFLDVCKADPAIMNALVLFDTRF